MSHGSSRWLAVTMLVVGVTLSACGSSSASPTLVATPRGYADGHSGGCDQDPHGSDRGYTTTQAAANCPTGATSAPSASAFRIRSAW